MIPEERPGIEGIFPFWKAGAKEKDTQFVFLRVVIYKAKVCQVISQFLLFSSSRGLCPEGNIFGDGERPITEQKGQAAQVQGPCPGRGLGSPGIE